MRFMGIRTNRQRMKLKRLIYISTILVFSITGSLSCTRKVSPAITKGNSKGSYDAAAFNYIYVEGIKQKLMGNGGEALKRFEQAININPRSDASYYQIAQILTNSGDIANAKKFLKKAIEIDEKNKWYLIMEGGLYYQEKNLDSAIYYYEKVVKYFPGEENLQLTLGNLYSENKNYNQAISIFSSFDSKYGLNENSTVQTIRTLMMAERYNDALEKANVLLKEEPDNVLFNGLLAEIYRGKGETGKAREVYRVLLERNPDDPQIQLAICDFLISEKDYSELLLLLNSVMMNTSVKKEDKIALFARLIDLNELIQKHSDELIVTLMVFEASYKNDEIIPMLRPELLTKLGKLDDAASRLEEIINENPDNYYPWEKLLLVYNEMKDYKNLMIKGEECATKFNRSFLAKILYANGALETKNYEVALEELRKAEILAGDNKEFLTQVLTMRADVYYRMKDYLKAFDTFEKALKNNNEDLTVINNYAYYLAEQNTNLKEAEVMAKKVVEREKGNTTYLDTYAWVLYKRGKIKEAAKIMEGIIKSGEKENAEWYEHYGFILKKQHDCARAEENWNIAMKLDSTKTNLLDEIKNCGK
jgi:tetratricopeptide (TPR) repeat protein